MAQKYSDSADYQVMKSSSIGEINRAKQIIEELHEAYGLSSDIDSLITGKLDKADSPEQIPASHLSGMLHEILTLACNIRGTLSSVRNSLDPQIKQAKSVSRG